MRIQFVVGSARRTIEAQQYRQPRGQKHRALHSGNFDSSRKSDPGALSSNAPSGSEQMGIAFIRGSHQVTTSDEQRTSRHDESEVQPTQRLNEFFELDDTLGPKVLTRVKDAVAAEAEQNSEIGAIIGALNSIKYDNTLLKDRNLLDRDLASDDHASQDELRTGN